MSEWYGALPDASFIRGDAPMTKEEVRALVLSYLRLGPASLVCDVGAGTGAVSVDCARCASKGMVYSIERDESALSLLERNSAACGLSNIRIIRGEAPQALAEVPAFDRVFIGGSGRRIRDIQSAVWGRLPAGGRVVITAVTLDTLESARKFFLENNIPCEIILVSVSRLEESGRATLLKAQNPVFIMHAERPPV